jgi:hypothetical protein
MRWRIGLVALGMVCAAHAAPGKVNAQQAEKFIRDLRLAIDQGPAQIESMPKRRAHGAKLVELEARSRRLFGDVFAPKFGSCVKAAAMIRTVWTDQMLMAERQGSPREVAWLSQNSVTAGVERFACSEAIDELRPAIPGDCLVVLDLSNPNAPAPVRPAHCPKL